MLTSSFSFHSSPSHLITVCPIARWVQPCGPYPRVNTEVLAQLPVSERVMISPLFASSLSCALRRQVSYQARGVSRRWFAGF